MTSTSRSNPSCRYGCFFDLGCYGPARFISLLIFACFLPICLFAVPAVVLDENTRQYRLGLFLELLEDPDGRLTYDDVTRPDMATQFVRSTQQTPIPGYVYSDYWVRFTVVNPLDRVFEGYLEYRSSHSDLIEQFERIDGGPLGHRQAGRRVPFEQKEIRSRFHVFRIQLPPGGRAEYYLHISNNGPVSIPLTIWQPKAFIEKIALEETLIGLFYGLLGVMLLYHLFLFVILRDRRYLYYIFFIGSTIWYHLASADGLGYLYLWPDNNWLTDRTLVLAWMLSIGTYVLFSRSFLNSAEAAPRLHRIISAVMLLVLINGLISLFGDLILYYRIGLILQLLGTFILVGIGWVILKRQERSAYYYLFAMLIILTGATLTVLRNAGLLADSMLVEYAVHIAVSFQAVILAMGLADRIKTIQRERTAAQEEALENRRIAIDNLKKADQLKDEFLAGTSHELKTPLHGIIGLSESLIGGSSGPLPSGVQRDLGLIVGSARRLSFLVGDLLDFSRLKHDDLNLVQRPVNLHSMVEIVLSLQAAVGARTRLSFRNRVPTDFPSVWADENRLQQILTNLIGNAVKYTVEGSVTVCARVETGMAVISVKDTGSGIDPDHLEEIFEPFRQLGLPPSGERGGIGLGLAITRRLIEHHGGRIEVDSTPGLGSDFRFTLPLSDPAAIPADQAVMPGEPAVIPVEDPAVIPGEGPVAMPSKDRVGAGAEVTAVVIPTAGEESNEIVPQETMKTGGRSLLLVEDDPVNRQVVSSYLFGTDFRLMTATNGAEALETIRNGPPPDLVLLDIMMPVMNGFDFCREFRKQFTSSAVPIVFLTAPSQAADLVQGFALGANDYITKPFSREELLIRIDNQMRQRDGIQRVSALRNLVLQGLQVFDAKVLMQAIMQMLFEQLRLSWIGLILDGKLVAEQRIADCTIDTASIKPPLLESQTNGASSLDLKVFNHLESAEGNAKTIGFKGFLSAIHGLAGHHAICLRMAEIDDYQLVAFRQPEQTPFCELDAEYVELVLQTVTASRKSVQALMNQRDLIEAIYRVQLHLPHVLFIRTKSPFCEIYFDGNRRDSEIVRIPLQTLDLFFSNDVLVRVHRSCIVNANRVVNIRKRNHHDHVVNLKTATGKTTLQSVGRVYLPRLRKTHPQWFTD
jgi:two-component system, sensor histidine kinase LadS